ncbi:type II toxin-antitoxin system RelE family toxin [Komagataeibacter swingsii]|uniref:Type II toxin-antitoxin system mRNA interferase toxin, RelE/StbE family n=1 Tax=Komagataeibacter swingsii TaxID=215220 RepID=A0A2V4RHJ1_9PROT|nr:type II toxin-antitoxin system RelE/ParE family toxin [Komagataeibacter swingsii]PYD68155.1 type II toxin-antitoxin system mRNA interferase toxin, RelE/StbE family [Komagataeibacter swingsii]GBQ58427.1 translation repressor RelE/RelB/StbE [Komagataeibacter swingsii DSM 16373]
MTEYAIEFDDRALREWDGLDGSVRKKFEKKLEKLVLNPYSPGNELHGDLAGLYKIKLRQDGYRLVYQVVEQRIVIFVIAVGRREDNEIYMSATGRVPTPPIDQSNRLSNKGRKR